ncbi:AcrR family transcriptional regulator [Mumia flava]|uniref:AcrR family transcriptional regulator n=1 Tax=Mumia flava TaxID=1348852 RepID=A0A2M9B6U6_9ACTN|nr:TetR/AcrR family transcriptional regulator [Mumia flava]PJJ53681.1 AcrR family transcriptional regulator [Mumia flava]
MAKTQGQKDRRANLIRATVAAVIEHGADVKLTEIAKKAGLTSGAVLYHYPDVQTLVLEANRAGTERFYDERMRTIAAIDDPVEKLVVTIRSGLPRDTDDDAVRLFCELGGAARRHPVYGSLLTSLYDRQVAMYQVILETGAARGDFALAQDSLTIGRNLVALEDAYGYRMMAGHPTIDHEVACELLLDYARLATGNPLSAKPTDPTSSPTDPEGPTDA